MEVINRIPRRGVCAVISKNLHAMRQNWCFGKVLFDLDCFGEFRSMHWLK